MVCGGGAGQKTICPDFVQGSIQGESFSLIGVEASDGDSSVVVQVVEEDIQIGWCGEKNTDVVGISEALQRRRALIRWVGEER